MDKAQLADVLSKHSKWIRLETDGIRADLRSANLSGANLRGADLRSANLSGADLSGANLKDTILADINWLAYIGIVPNADGKARAYKMTNAQGEGPFQGGINYARKSLISVADIDADPSVHCGRGINLATFQWCLGERQEGYRLFLMEFEVSSNNLCCPIATDGKFRVKSARKVGECDWHGNLKPKSTENPAATIEG
jgi:hypothetical protein